MHRVPRTLRIVAAVGAVLALLVGAWSALARPGHQGRLARVLRPAAQYFARYLPVPPAPGPVQRPREGGLDVTFLVTADTHFGWGVHDDPEIEPKLDPVEFPVGIDREHVRVIQQMNTIAGRLYPTTIGGRVDEPRGVLVAGDLTENGKPSEWKRFAAYYGRDGTDGLLRYPVYEGFGNHDWNHGDYVARQVAERHGDVRYSWEWGDLTVVCLADAPGRKGLSWLQETLAKTGRERPVILFFHYPLAGAYSETNWFGYGPFRERLVRALEGFNVVGVFHGHFHATGSYRWHGYDVYNVGSAKYRWNSFAVVRVTDDRMTVASWNYRHRRWWWWHTKPINLPPGVGNPERLQVTKFLEIDRQPVIFDR